MRSVCEEELREEPRLGVEGGGPLPNIKKSIQDDKRYLCAEGTHSIEEIYISSQKQKVQKTAGYEPTKDSKNGALDDREALKIRERGKGQ